MYDFLIAPFIDYVFLRRALVACMGIALGCGPVGVLLVLRRMSLMGDALSHAILPGIAIGYIVAGFWLPALTLGGILAGLIVALISGWIARQTLLNEDASFTGFYLISLALGVLIVSIRGGAVDLMHMLFGSVLAVDQESLLLIAFSTTATLVILALIYRPLILECFDPLFLRLMGVKGSVYHGVLLLIVVVNLVAAYQTLGTMMALGVMMLPAITARLLARQVWSSFLIAISVAVASSYIGLVTSYHLNWPSGPTIILVAGIFYGLALIYSWIEGLRTYAALNHNH